MVIYKLFFMIVVLYCVFGFVVEQICKVKELVRDIRMSRKK